MPICGNSLFSLHKIDGYFIRLVCHECAHIALKNAGHQAHSRLAHSQDYKTGHFDWLVDESSKFKLTSPVCTISW